jgi:hypothetical protein
MKRPIKQSLVLVATTIITTQPCFAEDSAIKSAAMLPVKAAGVFVGLTLGTPIAIARLTKKRFHEYVNDNKDMGDDGGLVLALPMSIGEGFAQGLYYGPRNAIVNSDKPFSKDSLSLQDSPDGK